MAIGVGKLKRTKIGIGLAAGALLGLVMPAAGLALPSFWRANSGEHGNAHALGVFTPAMVHPSIARRVNANALNKRLRFTPAGSTNSGPRTVTVAVRVGDSGLAMGGKSNALVALNGKGATLKAAPGLAVNRIVATQYNLGVSRGYLGFAKAADSTVTPRKEQFGLAKIVAPRLEDDSLAAKPARLMPRLVIERGDALSRETRRASEQNNKTVEFGGAFRVTRNLNVTAGLRIEQERDRLAPRADNLQDNQAFYVGTQFRF